MPSAVPFDALLPAPPQALTAAPQVDVVIPVHNEEVALGPCVRRLHGYLSGDDFPFSWRVVVADNASTDATRAVARDLAATLPQVQLTSLPAKGRGRALRAAWSASDAQVVCYMDVDLSTDLRGLLPLVAPLLSGHSDLAIGSRLAGSARVIRGPKRELISRTYNRILRLTLRTHFSDAQCGFKAGRTSVIKRLLPQVQNEEWFFDTELLVLAERQDLRIHEVPVDWIDDPDSRVDIVATALEDLRGIARLLAGTRIATFAAIGTACTVAYAVLFLLLRGLLPPAAASAVALAVTAVANTAANRRLTFGVRGRAGALRHHALGAVVYLLTVALTSGALAVLTAVDPRPSRLIEVAVAIGASACATVTRFVAMRWWIFAPAAEPQSQPQPQPRAAHAGAPPTLLSTTENG
ncbi:GtrB-like O-antigen conversion [Paraconexibacter sp. AEG42_29]|uniref:dolichyl-phosphate beta-glucosyltransferase n=1 Tax=Paraconexibacter sp. AEG42_29 TaxID=2997339 RepID=A0AAU7B286_9ACTN